MGRLTRIVVLAIGFFMSIGCLSSKRTPAPFSEIKSVEEATRQSIGMLMLRDGAASTPIGQGTIIAETTEQYVGLTSLVALQRCLPQGEVENHCWLRIDDAKGEATFARVDHYSGEAKLPVDWSEFSDGQAVSLAMFGINKRHMAHILKPIEINTEAWPKEAIPAKVIAYAGASHVSDSSLAEQMATAWVFKGELIYTSAQIEAEPEGAPLFVYVPSQTDMRMVWRLAGIVGRSEQLPILMARSLANLSIMQKKYPELAVWRRLDRDKGAPSASGVINIETLTVEQSADRARFKVILKQSDFKEKLFSVLGFPLSIQDSLDISIDQDVVKIEFEAEKTLHEKLEQLQWIYFEYFDADEKPIFTACMPESKKSKDYSCGKVPLG